MKAQLKPLGMAAAVAAATATFAGSANATIDAGNLGDLAIVPYYTTMSGYVTGVHITNTSAATQVVKLRMRRGSDSMDALDFNLILSPYDMWTGTIRMEDNGAIVFRTSDTSCTAPAPNLPGVGFEMPDPTFDTLIDFRDGAEEGYLEVIGMAQAATEAEPIAIAAKHPNLGGSVNNDPMPRNCARVRDNFFRNATTGPSAGPFFNVADRGVLSHSLTHQRNNVLYDCDATPGDGVADPIVCPNDYVDTPNVLSVSYFVRDADSGMEMGGNAVHIADFATEPMMSNQVSYDPTIPDYYSYFYPDLDGGNGIDATRGLYDTVVRPDLGVDSISNDWSVNANLSVQTDWVITFPGQYTMVHWLKYIASIQSDADDLECNITTTAATATAPEDPYCDFRDIPAVLSIEDWDREEQERIVVTPEDELVVSPSVGTDPERPAILLPYEVNVIKWFGPDTDGEDGVLGSQYAGSIDVGVLGVNGWAQLSVAPDPAKAAGGGQRICSDKELAIAATLAQVDANCTAVVNTAVPMVGFTAWKRSFPDRPDGNYGRLIDHTWSVTPAPAPGV